MVNYDIRVQAKCLGSDTPPDLRSLMQMCTGTKYPVRSTVLTVRLVPNLQDQRIRFKVCFGVIEVVAQEWPYAVFKEYMFRILQLGSMGFSYS